MRIVSFVLLAIVTAAAQTPPADAPSILADPDSRTYYLYAAAEGGVAVYRSRDLQTWKGPRQVFTVPEGMWADPADGVSAPEVHLYRGRYYLLATLRNRSAVVEKSPPAWREITRRATHIFVSDSPEGPFKAVSEKPPAREDFMTSDGTLYFEADIPYFVYAHDWNQVIDGAIEAVRLKSDLTAPAGEPFLLFRASTAPWLKEQRKASKEPRSYVAQGPFLHKTKNGELLLLWSSLKGKIHVVTVARSLSGRMEGPWRQAEPLLDDDSGQATIFTAFDGRLMLAGSHASRARILEIDDTGGRLHVKRSAAPRIP